MKVLLELRPGDEAAALAFRDAIPDDATSTLAPHWEGSGRVQLSPRTIADHTPATALP